MKMEADMVEKKKASVGQKFLKLLEEVATDKGKLLNLASAVIQNSPSHRDLKSRNIPDDETAVKMGASVAKFHAMSGKDVSTDGMLTLIADTYRAKGFGSPAKFKEDFKKRFPQQYEAKAKSNVANNLKLQCRNKEHVY